MKREVRSDCDLASRTVPFPLFSFLVSPFNPGHTFPSRNALYYMFFPIFAVSNSALCFRRLSSSLPSAFIRSKF